MIKTCPFKCTAHYSHIDCSDRCVMYNDGCLFKQAIQLYIQNHTPLKMKCPDLNAKHDYDKYGIDWYPHGPNDIAP